MNFADQLRDERKRLGLTQAGFHSQQQQTRKMKTKGYTATRPWRLTRNDGKVEAERYRKCEGASFSGWIVRSTTDQFSYSDPLPNKEAAIKHLLEWTA